MLVLSRKSEESIVLGGNIEVKILSIRGDQVSLGFDAPKDVAIYRKEIYDAMVEDNHHAGHQGEDELMSIRRKLAQKLRPTEPPANAQSA